MRFAGVVILYNPPEDVLDNIKTYLNEIDFLYIFDNSEVPDQDITAQFESLPYVKYVPFYDNKGISFALNCALELANDYDFLLTMDQDSRFYDGMMMNYRTIVEQHYAKDNTVAMFGVNRWGLEERAESVLFVDKAITSGSLVNVRIAKEIGGFDENLFIDEVDYDFCYNAIKHGYKILCLMNICLQHHLGNPVEKTIFGRKVSSLNHGAIRKYYISRNLVYMIQKYPHLRLTYYKTLFGYFLKCLLLEEDKLKRLTFMFKGVKDAFIGRMGRYSGK